MSDTQHNADTPASTPRVPIRPALQASVQAAISATGASSGWLLAVGDDQFVVVAASGADPRALLGSTRRLVGVAGYALGSGQPAAVQIRSGDADNAGAGNSGGEPGSLLAAPCIDPATGEVGGVLELAGAPAGRFTFDDVETIALISEIAGAALGDVVPPPPSPPSPAALAALLARLEGQDAVRYGAIADLVVRLAGSPR